MAEKSQADGERIAKFLARAGVASRREAERMIEQGIVTVDGVTLTTPAFKIREGMDIRVDGSRVKGKEPPRLWRYHKPSGLVTTHKDPQGRPTVFDAIGDRLPRVISVGRLDLTTEGLLLLTNDGALARQLELPANAWVRRYRIRANGKTTQETLDALARGVTIDGVEYKPIKAKLDQVKGANVWITASITEGKNREIRKLMEHFGCVVNRLIRVQYGPFYLGKLQSGALEEIEPARVAELLKYLQERGVEI